MPTTRRLFLASAALSPWFASQVLGQDIQIGRPRRGINEAEIPDDAALTKACNQGELVFIGTVSTAEHSLAVAPTKPPLRSMMIEFKEVQRLRGTLPEKLEFHYSVRADDLPAILEGSCQIVVAHRFDGQTWSVSVIVPAVDRQLVVALNAVKLPIGWTLVYDKPVSPWADRKMEWPGGKNEASTVCSKTGRPALLAGPGIQMRVEQVIHGNIDRDKNPFGEGQFRITVVNTNKQAVEVPALLSRGGEIQWNASIVAIQGAKSHVFPMPAGEGEFKPTHLAAGQGVTGIVNTLELGDGIQWPYGGSRIHFTFALGEISAGNFFYHSGGPPNKVRAKK